MSQWALRKKRLGAKTAHTTLGNCLAPLQSQTHDSAAAAVGREGRAALGVRPPLSQRFWMLSRPRLAYTRTTVSISMRMMMTINARNHLFEDPGPYSSQITPNTNETSGTLLGKLAVNTQHTKTKPNSGVQ